MLAPKWYYFPMLWLRTHPFASLFAGASLVLLIIFVSIQGTSTPASSGGPVVAVGGGNILEDPGISERYFAANIAPPNPTVQPDTAHSTFPIPLSSTSPRTTAANTPSQSEAMLEDGEEVDLSMFFSSEITLPVPSSDMSLADQLLKEAYALVPSTFLPVTKPVSRTPEQQALHVYGNRAGLAILTFQNAHTTMAETLTDWFEDRSNEAHTGASNAIAEDMIALGGTLGALVNVPASAKAANENLATSYRDAGNKLLQVIAAGGSEDALVTSMKTYNSSVEDFTRTYIALVDLFSEKRVTFSPSDAGSAFQFQASSF